MRSLHLTLPFGADETPTSYVSCLAARHGVPARTFCTDMGFSLQKIADGDTTALEALARLSGADQGALTHNALVRKDGEHILRGNRLAQWSLARTRVRACPLCFADDIAANPELPQHIAVHCRVAWLVEHIRTCVHHGAALVEFAVAKNTEMYDFAALAARSGDLQNLPTIRRQANGLESYLTDRLTNAPTIYPWLDSFEFSAAAKTCEVFGAVSVLGRNVRLDSMTEANRFEAAEAGFKIVAGGEPTIRAFLHGLQQTFEYRPGVAHDGPNAVFGALFKWASFSAEGDAFDRVRDLLRRHVVETMPIGAGVKLFGKTVETRLVHSIWSASLEYAAHPKRLRKILATTGLLPEGHEAMLPNLVRFDAAKAQALFEAGVFHGVSQNEIGRYIGSNHVQAAVLINAGILKPAFAVGEGDSPLRAQSFPKPDLDDFLRRLTKNANLIQEPNAHQHNIPTAAKKARCSAAEIVSLILDDKLDWVGSDVNREKYMAVLVDVREIKEKTLLPPLDGLIPRKIEKVLKTSWEVINALIDHGILKTVRRTNPLNRCPADIVTYEELAKFQAQYISLFQLAKERGLHFRRLKQDLDERGIAPALDPERFHATFYVRDIVG